MKKPSEVPLETLGAPDLQGSSNEPTRVAPDQDTLARLATQIEPGLAKNDPRQAVIAAARIWKHAGDISAAYQEALKAPVIEVEFRLSQLLNDDRQGASQRLWDVVKPRDPDEMFFYSLGSPEGDSEVMHWLSTRPAMDGDKPVRDEAGRVQYLKYTQYKTFPGLVAALKEWWRDSGRGDGSFPNEFSEADLKLFLAWIKAAAAEKKQRQRASHGAVE